MMHLVDLVRVLVSVGLEQEQQEGGGARSRRAVQDKETKKREEP